MACGFALVLAAPGALVWNALRVREWNDHTLRIRFQSVKYARVGLEFVYLVQNRTFRSVRLRPDDTDIRVLPTAGYSPMGYANLPQPFEVPARSETPIVIRLELPLRAMGLRGTSDEQTRRVLAQRVREGNDDPVSQLPMSQVPHEQASDEDAPPIQPWNPDTWLRGLDGFEIRNDVQHARLVFPRRW